VTRLFEARFVAFLENEPGRGSAGPVRYGMGNSPPECCSDAYLGSLRRRKRESRKAIREREKMQTKDAIKFALTASNRAVLSVIDEMSGSATTFPTANGGCHPLWVLGHLTLVEGMIPLVFFGDKNPAAEWQQYFGESSEPVADPSAYPAFAEVREKYLQLREQNLKLLDSLGEADLDKPTKARLASAASL
jgi:hypothetical protein